MRFYGSLSIEKYVGLRILVLLKKRDTKGIKTIEQEELKCTEKYWYHLDGSSFAECSLAHVKAIAKGCQVTEVVLNHSRIYSGISRYGRKLEFAL